MPLLTITRATSTRQEVRLTGDDGAVLECYETNLLSPRSQQKLAQVTGLTCSAIAAAAVEVRDTPAPKYAPKPSVELPYTAPPVPGAVPDEPFTVIIRPKGSPAEAGIPFTAPTPAEALRLALDYAEFVGADPVMQWEGYDRLCCCDCDYHELPFHSRPRHTQLEARAAGIQPRPVAFHASHGRGMKMYYVAQPGYTARELAAVAAVCWCNQDARATADLVRISRHPRYPSSAHSEAAGVIYTQTPSADVAPVAAWLTCTVNPEAVDDWLNARGWQRGQKLPHSECPIDPAHVSSSSEPVSVLDEGIHCFSCAGRGVAIGRKPGYVPYSSLVGGVPAKTAVMIRNAVHWTHARLVLKEEVKLSESTLEAAYVAAVKLCHGADSPQAQAVTASGRDLIRMPGRWVSPDGTTTYTQNLHGMIGALPGVWMPGERLILPDRRDTFLQPADLSHYGYFPVTPIHGVKIYGEYLPYPDGRIAFATPGPAYRTEGGRFAPRYRSLNERLNIEQAWQRVEQTFPGVSRNYVYLLIALKGLAEGATVQAPFAIVTGPSGSGKSSTVHLAASICGDTASEPLYTADSVRLMQAIAGGLDAGSFVVLNEIFKEAQKAKLKPRAAVDPVLTMTPNSLAHRLYIGPRPLGRLPALVLTDIEIPAVVHADVQLARRLVWVELPHKVAWEKPVSEAGFGEISRYRLSSPEAANACDAILSDVIDRFFRTPTTVAAVAKELGFGTLEEAGDCGQVRDTLRRFFTLVCGAPDLTGSDAERFPGAGWKVISRGDTSELAEIWNQIANGLQGDEWGESRIATGEDWSQLLGVSPRVHLDRGTFKNSLYLRFRVGPKAAPEWVSKQGSEKPN